MGKIEDAIKRLSDMVTQTENKEMLARINYELWKLDKKETYRKCAIKQYKKLYEKKPTYQYEKQIEELVANDTNAYTSLSGTSFHK